jgi:hypothetical protein
MTETSPVAESGSAPPPPAQASRPIFADSPVSEHRGAGVFVVDRLAFGPDPRIPPEPNVRCRSGEATLPGMHASGRDAPIAAARLTMIGRLKSTQISHCTKRGLSPAHLTLARLLSGIIESAH